jgi:endoglucanase
MVSYMKEVATRHKIPHQLEILTGGGTDTAGIQRFTPGGSIAGAVSIPTRHIHQVIEMADKTDIRNAIDLLLHSVKELDQYDWSFK